MQARVRPLEDFAMQVWVQTAVRNRHGRRREAESIGLRASVDGGSVVLVALTIAAGT